MENNKENMKTVQDALNEIRSMADAKTVIGDPINVNPNVTILPISKVSVGLGLSGKNSNKEKGNTKNSSGATGISVNPVGFLVINASGDVKMLNVGENTGYDALGILNTVNSVDKALEKAPDIIEKVKALFAKKKTDQASDSKL